MAYRKWVLLLAGVVLFLAVYLAAHVIYDSRQHHYFDPFLQSYAPVFDIPETKDSAEIRILCLGGSTTLQPGVPLEENYPFQLQEILRGTYPGRKITVLNAGQAWFTSRHSLINYSTYAHRFNPDIVIVMHAINDLYRSFSPEKYSRGPYNDLYTHFYGADIEAAEPVTFEEDFVRKFNRLFRINEKRNFIEEETPVSAYRSLSAYGRNMSDLFELILDDSAHAFFLLQPSLYDSVMSPPEEHRVGFGHEFCNERREDGMVYYPSYRSLYKAMQIYNTYGCEAASNSGAVCLRSDTLMKKTLQYFKDDVHYTAEGARTLAKYVADQLIASGFIETSGNK